MKKKVAYTLILAALWGGTLAWAGSEIISPLSVLPTTGIGISNGTDIHLYSAPMIIGGVFHDGQTPAAYMLSSDSERKKLMVTDSAGNAETYTDSDVLAGASARGGAMYGDQVQVVIDYYPGGGAYASGLYSVDRAGTYSQWALNTHGGANSLIPGVKNSLFLPATLPESLGMPAGVSAKALRSNYTFGPVGNIFFSPDGTLNVFTSSPNRRRLATIDAAGVSDTVTDSDILVGTNLRAGALYGDGYVVAIDYAPVAGNSLSGIYALNSNGTYTQWNLTGGHSGISDLIPAPQGGYYFTDFENDNIWHISTPGAAETPVLTNPPVALMSVGVDGSGNLCAVNWIPGEWWSNGGVNAVYRIVGDTAVMAAEAPEGSRLYAVAAGKGGLFGSSFYVTDTLGGRVFRLEANNTLTPVITGLPNPGRIKFDPVTGNMAVVCDGQYIIWFGENLTPFDAPVESAETPKGVFFSDFENDNVWFVPDKGMSEIGVLEGDILPGLGTITYNDLNETIYALNWAGGWPFGGVDGVYAINPNGAAVQVATGSFAGIAMSKGGAFGKALYVSQSGTGKILRLEENGTTTDVVTGLPAPGAISFDPVSFVMTVVCDSGRQIAWIGNNLLAPAAGSPGTVGNYFAPEEQAFYGIGNHVITRNQATLSLPDSDLGYYHAVSKRTLTGDFDITADIAMSPGSLLSGQNRFASLQVISDVAGQSNRQIAYIGIMQKTVGYASTGGLYYAYTDMMIAGGWGRFNSSPMTGNQPSGRFRIKREGAIISTYYRVDEQWVELSVGDAGFSDRVRIFFHLDTSWDATAPVNHSAVFKEIVPNISPMCWMPLLLK